MNNIPGTKGDLSDKRAGLAFFRITYSDGSKGILVLSYHLNGGPRPTPLGSPATAFGGSLELWHFREINFLDGGEV